MFTQYIVDIDDHLDKMNKKSIKSQDLLPDIANPKPLKCKYQTQDLTKQVPYHFSTRKLLMENWFDFGKYSPINNFSQISL